MRKNRVGWCWGVAMVLGVLCGCTTKVVPPQETGMRYISENEVIAGKASAPTMYDLESSVQTLMSKMRASQRFAENYNSVKTAKGAIPVVVIGKITNLTSERLQGRLDAIGESVRTSLFDSGLFDVKDDSAAEAISARMLRSADEGLEDGSLVEEFGTHDSPDFIVLGDLRHFEDVGGYHTYRLRLSIHNLRTGKIVWEGIQTKIKL